MFNDTPIESFFFLQFSSFGSAFCFMFFNFSQFVFFLFSWSSRGAPRKCMRSPYGSAEHRFGTAALWYCKRTLRGGWIIYKFALFNEVDSISKAQYNLLLTTEHPKQWITINTNLSDIKSVMKATNYWQPNYIFLESLSSSRFQSIHTYCAIKRQTLVKLRALACIVNKSNPLNL